MNKGRVEAFSDGIFAIAITLLVLTIDRPTDFEHLTHSLAAEWPGLAAYVVSFMVIGIEWVNHHTVFSHLQRVNRTMFYLNLLLLMTIVFLPYPTGVFGEALHKGHDAKTAAVFYSIVMAINAVIWAAAWLYASVGRRLLTAEFPESHRRMSTYMFALGPIPYGAAIGLALINPYLCLGFHGVLALYYAFDPISQRLERRSAT